MKVKVTIEVELADMISDTEHEKRWLREEILVPNQLVLHSNEIGDEIGLVVAVSKIEFSPQ